MYDKDVNVTYLLPSEGHFAKMKDEYRGRLAILKLDTLALQSQDLYIYVFNILFFRAHIIDVLELAPLPLGRRVDVRPQSADQRTAHKLWRNHICIDEAYALADGAGTREFAQPHLPVRVWSQVYRSSQLDREGTDRVVWVEVLRGVTQ